MRSLSPLLSVAFLSLLPALGHAQPDVVVETRTFHVPGNGPRVEVNMAVLGGSVTNPVNDRGFHRSVVEVLTLVERDGEIVDFTKTLVKGPERLDSIPQDIIHQEFFDLAPGGYDLSVEVRDATLDGAEPVVYAAPLAVGALGGGVGISDILLAERIDEAPEGQPSKYGYHVVPLLSDYFPSNLNMVNFYAEVYGTEGHFGKDSLYLLTYQLESYESKKVHGNLKRIMRPKARAVEPIIAQFDISNLSSGNYLLAIEVRDRQGELVVRREQFIQRNNPIKYNYDLQAMDQLDVRTTFADLFTERDTLAEHIRSLRPIADPLERKIIDDRWKDREMDLMKRFFYSFWANRSADPETAWREYREQVVKVNRLFSCRVMKGYETDRGYVYLKYGAPNSMMDRFHEMDSYPYTMWHYYRAGKYTNRRFVFYQASLANDCFELLHSEVPGEIQNPRWNQILHSRNVPMPNVDPERVNTMGGERALEFFEMPR
jgi:GWxTD domain-containing protein